MTHHPLQWKDWCTGNTKSAYVNANMHELRLTGFMSNRGRQNVASYAIHDMGLDWRECAAWFERWLIDFDPCSNTGNCLYVAGIGNDRPQRKFDVDWQAERYDPDGVFSDTGTGWARNFVRSRRRVMMYWNVTYNDPNRWKAVYKASGGRLPWWRGVRETFAGLPVGSPKLDWFGGGHHRIAGVEGGPVRTLPSTFRARLLDLLPSPNQIGGVRRSYALGEQLFAGRGVGGAIPTRCRIRSAAHEVLRRLRQTSERGLRAAQ